MNDETLSELLLAYQHSHDTQALARVFDAAAPRLLGLGLHLAPSRHEAEDLVQATFLTVLESIDRFDPDRSATGWMLGILTNKARESRRRGARLLDPDRLEPATPASPAAEAQSAEQREVVEEAVTRLPDRYREAVELALHRGLGPNEIASELGRTPGSVRTQLHRAMAKLRPLLPTGFALPSALAVFDGPELESLRRRVLEASESTQLAGGSVGSGVALGTAWKVAASMIVVSGLGALLWSRSPEPTSRDAVAVAPQEPTSIERTHLETEVLAQVPRAEVQRAREATEEAGPAATTTLEIHDTEVHEVRLATGEGLSFPSGTIVSATGAYRTGLEADFFMTGSDVVESGGRRALASIPVPDSLDFENDEVSGDCALRSVVALDPETMHWRDKIRGNRDPLSESFIVRLRSGGHAAVALLTRVLSSDRSRFERVVRWQLLPGEAAPRVREIAATDVLENGVWIDPYAYASDPYTDDLERRRSALTELADSKAAGRFGGDEVQVRSVWKRADAGLVDAENFAYTISTFCFEHDTRDDRALTRNDWSVAFDGDRIDVVTVTDDRSRIWSLGELDLTLLTTATLVPGELIGQGQEVTTYARGDSFLIHTLDTETDRWDAIRVLSDTKDPWVVFAWRTLETRELRRAAEGATEDTSTWIQGDTLRLQLRTDHGGGSANRAFLDGTVNRQVDEILTAPIDLAAGYEGREPSRAWIDGGRIPAGMAFEVRQVTWTAQPIHEARRRDFVVRLGEETIVEMEDFQESVDGQWFGSILLRRGQEQSSFAEVSMYTQCDVIIEGALIPDPPR